MWVLGIPGHEKADTIANLAISSPTATIIT